MIVKKVGNLGVRNLGLNRVEGREVWEKKVGFEVLVLFLGGLRFERLGLVFI